MPILNADGTIEGAAPSSAAPAVLQTASANDMQNLGQTSELRYTPPPKPKEPGLPQRIGEDIAKPAVEMQHAIGSGLQWLGDNMKTEQPFGLIGDKIARAGIVMRERATASLAKHFSNFTPNMADQIVGAVPTLAGYLGLAAVAGPELAVGALAGGAGLLTGSEEYNRFKAQGHTTDESNALATMIGVPTAGVMAAGFGVVSKLTSPWLTPLIGKAIADIVGHAAAGSVALGAQALTTGSLELATGAQPYEGKESLVNLMASTANATVLGGILGGAAGAGFALKGHAAIQEGFEKLGLSTQGAQQAAKDLLADTSHVVMDRLEKHMDMTPDEMARVGVSPEGAAAGVKTPDILDRGGLPRDMQYPPIGDKPLPADQVADMFAGNKYVKIEPIDVNVKTKGSRARQRGQAVMPDVDPEKMEKGLVLGGQSEQGARVVDTKATTQDFRQQFVGKRDAQYLRGGYLAEDIKIATGPENKAAKWDIQLTPEQRESVLKDPEKYMKAQMEENWVKAHQEQGEEAPPFKLSKEDLAKNVAEFERHRTDIEQSLRLSDNAKAAVVEARRFVNETGAVSQALGTIDHVIENYGLNHLYQPEPPQTEIKVTGASGVKTWSSHSLRRFFNDPLAAIAGGKKLVDAGLSDHVAILNREMANVNYGRVAADAITNAGPVNLAEWRDEGVLPPGWKWVGEVRKNIPHPDLPMFQRHLRLAAPEGIADGLKAITDPDYLRRDNPVISKIQDIQAGAKQRLLGVFSFFHDKQFLTQTLSSIDGAKTMAEMVPAMIKNRLASDDFRAWEIDLARHGLTSSMTHAAQDVLQELKGDQGVLGKVLNAPGLKQVNDMAKAHTDWLFGDYWRWIKTQTALKEVMAWQGKHPGASPEAEAAAKRSICQATNSTFGGQNWEVLGINKTQLSWMRLLMLAPDWVVSQGMVTKAAFTPSLSPESSIARATLFRATAGGYAVANGLNYLINGKWCYQNDKGHQFGEVEVAPHVYVPLIGGAAGEIGKLASRMAEYGKLQGALAYAAGKVSPGVGSGVTAVTGRNIYGQSIWKGDSELAKTVHGAWDIALPTVGVPIGGSGSYQYATREPNQTPAGWAAIGTSLGRYAKPSPANEAHDMREKVIEAYKHGDMATVQKLIKEGELSQSKANALQRESKVAAPINAIKHLKMDAALDHYKGASDEDKQTMVRELQAKYSRFLNSGASPNEIKRVQKKYKELVK